MLLSPGHNSFNRARVKNMFLSGTRVGLCNQSAGRSLNYDYWPLDCWTLKIANFRCIDSVIFGMRSAVRNCWMFCRKDPNGGRVVTKWRCKYMDNLVLSILIPNLAQMFWYLDFSDNIFEISVFPCNLECNFCFRSLDSLKNIHVFVSG